MSLEFLQNLRALEVRCYLASGTDVEFVKNEAETTRGRDALQWRYLRRVTRL